MGRRQFVGNKDGKKDGKMKSNSILSSIFPILLPVGLILAFYFYSPSHNCDEKSEIPISNIKQKGAHVYGKMDSTDFQELAHNNIEWTTLLTWASQDGFDGPIVSHHNGDSLLMRRTDSSWVKRIELARAAGFKVFVKPHIWIHNDSEGKWRADIFPTNEKNWQLWKNSYQEYIFRYAKIAEQANAEMFCIGAELSRLSIEKPMYWRNLIQGVRSIYSGKITYAANWNDEFEKITFWDDLDFIGIQAYFPLAKQKNPGVEQISEGWNKYLPGLEAIHNKYNRKILFTEMGYKSTANSAIMPWQWLEDTSTPDHEFSAETQANCYQAFFNTVWDKDWFAGVHIWVLRADHIKYRDVNNLDFTPQGKPAEKIIAKGFE